MLRFTFAIIRCSRKPLPTLLACISAYFMGCAGIHPSSQAASRVVATAHEPLFVALPAVPDTVDSLLSKLGWAPGRFAQQLRQEITFQFNKRGIGTVTDSAAKSSVVLTLNEYGEGGGLPSRYAGSVLLKTSLGVRAFNVASSNQGAQSIERSDPTVDNIRRIAESVVKEACKGPETKKPPRSDFNPPLLMIF